MPSLEPPRDRLTNRERRLYRAIHGIALALIAAGFTWYFVFRLSTPGVAEAVLFSLVAVVVAVFGLALRNGIRVIHGVSWLREEAKL